MIKRVELSNFISHRHSIIELDKGVSVFIGKNGSGKSSVIDAVTYALYGKHMRDDNKNIVRDGSNEAYAVVEFTHNNKVYRAERRVNRSGRLEAALLSEYTDGRWRQIASGERRQFGESVSEQIARILGLDYERMSIAGIVQQGEIARIVEYKPKEFKELINSIVGIDMLDYAYRRMPEVLNGFRVRLIKEYGYDDNGIESIDKRIKEYRDALESSTNEIARLKKILEDVMAKREEASKEYELMKQLRSKYETMNIQISNLMDYLKNKKRALEDESSELRKKIERAYNCMKIVEQEADIVAEMKSIDDRLEVIDKDILELESQMAAYRERRSNAESILNLIKEAKKRMRYLNDNSNVHDLFSNSKNGLNSIKESIDAKRHEISRIEGLLECSSVDLSDGICPVCKRRIDDLDHLIYDIQKERDELESRRSRLDAEIKELEERRRGFERELAEIEEKAKRYDEYSAFIKNVYSLLDSDDIDAKERECLSIINYDIKALNERISALKSERSKRKEQRSSLNSLYNDIVKANEFLSSNNISSKRDIERLEAELKEKERVRVLLERIDARDVSKLAIDEHSRSLVNTISRLMDECRGFSEERFRELEYNIKSIEDEEKRIEIELRSVESKLNDASKSMDEALRVRSILDSARKYVTRLEGIRDNVFHRDGVIAKSLRSWLLEQLSLKATEYAKVFDIGISDIRLYERDNSVDIRCYSRTGERDLQSMSGGEKIALALALRFAMAYVMGGYRLDFIIMDEPTIHLDEDKRSAIVDVVSSLASNTNVLEQIIVITHDTEIFGNANVDSIYRFEMSERGTVVRRE